MNIHQLHEPARETTKTSREAPLRGDGASPASPDTRRAPGDPDFRAVLASAGEPDGTGARQGANASKRGGDETPRSTRSSRPVPRSTSDGALGAIAQVILGPLTTPGLGGLNLHPDGATDLSSAAHEPAPNGDGAGNRRAALPGIPGAGADVGATEASDSCDRATVADAANAAEVAPGHPHTDGGSQKEHPMGAEGAAAYGPKPRLGAGEGAPPPPNAQPADGASPAQNERPKSAEAGHSATAGQDGKSEAVTSATLQGSLDPTMAAAAMTPAGTGSDNTLAPVNRMPDASASAGTPADAPGEAAQSAVNQAILRHVAHGEVLHPDLGRVEVSARMRGGEVDVRVTAQHSGASAVLANRAGAMVDDVRSANVHVGRFDFGSRDGSGGREHLAHGNGAKSGDNETPGSSDAQSGEPPTSAPATPTKRVRIVL